MRSSVRRVDVLNAGLLSANSRKTGARRPCATVVFLKTDLPSNLRDVSSWPIYWIFRLMPPTPQPLPERHGECWRLRLARRWRDCRSSHYSGAQDNEGAKWMSILGAL